MSGSFEVNDLKLTEKSRLLDLLIPAENPDFCRNFDFCRNSIFVLDSLALALARVKVSAKTDQWELRNHARVLLRGGWVGVRAKTP